MNSPTVIKALQEIRSSAVPVSRDRPIGAILLDAGLIRLEDVERILEHQREKGTRFGDAAVQLGIVKDADLRHALAYQFDHPVLAPGETNISREVVAAYDARDPGLDDLRALRNQILLRWLTAEGQVNRVVAVLGAGRAEGRTFIAANLAVTLSQMGLRALLIDADMRNGRIHKLFGLDNQHGLSAMLAERRVPNTLHRIEALRDLQVIGTGGQPPNPNDLLSRPEFGELLQGFVRSHDAVVIDSPAALAGPDALTIAARAQGVILVARKNRTVINDLVELAQQVTSVGATIVGSVLVE